MEEKIRELQLKIAEIQEKIEEINELKRITEAQYQKTVSEDLQKVQKLKSIANQKCAGLPETDPKKIQITEKIRAFEISCEEKSQDILKDIQTFTIQIEEHANNSALLTKQMIEIHSSSSS